MDRRGLDLDRPLGGPAKLDRSRCGSPVEVATRVRRRSARRRRAARRRSRPRSSRARAGSSINACDAGARRPTSRSPRRARRSARGSTPNALASSIRIPVAAALEAAPGRVGGVRGAAITIVRSASPGRREEDVSERDLVAVAVGGVEGLLADRAGGDVAEAAGRRGRRPPRRPRCPAPGRARWSRSGARSRRRASPSKVLGGVDRLERGRGALEREHHHDDRQQGGQERESVEAEVDQGSCAARATGPASCRPGIGAARDYASVHGVRRIRGKREVGADPARRRRAVRSRRCSPTRCARTATRSCRRARRPRGARPLRRAALRPRRPRHHAAEARRDRGLPAAAQPQPGADHHADREGRRDRQGARPRDRRRRLHHQAVLDARVPQPGARPRCGARRCSAAATGATSRSPPATLEIDFERRAVTCAASAAQLTYVEFEILAALAARARPGARPARCCSSSVWGDSAYRDPRTIDVHIRHLREKLERDPKHPEYLFTVRGVGYRFRD